MGFNHRLSNTGNLLTNTQFIEIPTTGSLRFNGSTGYLTIPSNAAVTLGTNAYTIEMWVYPNNNSQNAGLFQLSSSATYVQTFPANQLSIQLYNGYIQFGSDTAWNVGLGVAANAYVANQWYHVAMTRQSGGLTTFFINGVQVHSLIETTNYTGSYLVVGGFYQLPTYVLNGNLSNFRFVNGTAVYTSNFTPPTTALTAIANTVLLLNTTPSQPFVDSSSSNLAITVIGGVTSNTISPTLTIPNPLITSPKLRLSNTGIMYVAGQFDEYNLRVPLISYLVVAGGGGGADRHGGGGGGGGYLANTASLVPGVNYTITVGGGGVAGNYESGGLSPAGVGGKGSNSSISSIATSFGGGGGGTYDGNPTGTFGSGGGGGGNSFSGIAGIVGQGNSGGSGLNPGAGGGGGAGAVGGNANAGSGGAGKQWLNGNYYAGGGGGAWGSVTGPATPGGIGGGGAGAWNAATIEPGFTNTGGGGGGSRSEDTATVGRPGGSGIVIIRYDDIYPDAANTTGSPSFTNSGGFKTYTFTGSGTIRF